jgi:hypothetical protein
MLILTLSTGCIVQIDLKPRDDGDSDPSESVIIAHGVCMAVAVVILFPLGSTWIRLLHFNNSVWVHAGWQSFAYLVVLAGLGLGLYISIESDQVRF